MLCVTALAISAGGGAFAQTQQQFLQSSDQDVSTPGPIRLRQIPASSATQDRTSQPLGPQIDRGVLPEPYQYDDFERYVRRLAGVEDAPRPSGAVSTPQGDRRPEAAPPSTTGSQQPDIRRFGADLVSGSQAFPSADVNGLVPADYVIAPGDEMQLTLWGSVDADLRLSVDRTGRVSIPRVGSVMVAGVPYAQLPEVLKARVGQVFKNFQLSVSMGQLRSVRVYVTGFAKRPGAHFVGSLSTIVSAVLRSGGPSAAGSFRNIELRRDGQTIAKFDLYDLLLKGDKSADRVVQAEDVIYIGPVGTQVGLIGSVNKPAVFELKPGETVQDVLRMGGGFTPVADRTRLSLERLSDRDERRIVQLRLPDANSQGLEGGDVLRAFSEVDAKLSTRQQNKRVLVEGEVARPGEYVLPPDSTLVDALKAAGGITPRAYVFGTEFTRESVRVTQQQNYDRALRDLEVEFAKSSYTQRSLTADESAAQAAGAANATRLIERLREIRPTGRVVLQLDPNGSDIPPLALEDGDRLYIPALPNTVGVFGSVFNGGSYLYSAGRTVDDFLKLAGGPTRGADAGSAFVVRANGSVISARQTGNWFGSGTLSGLGAEPGDTVFVPEEVGKTTFIQGAKEWTQILANFGIGIAAIRTLR